MDKTAKILIVDDDENIRKALVAVLEDEGYAVESVDTGKKGIEKTETDFFNLALIDVRLPDMEGIEVLSGMRETSPKIRKIIITGDEAAVEVDTVWKTIPKDKKSVIKNEGVTKLKLARSPYGGWGVIQADIPGWDFS